MNKEKAERYNRLTATWSWQKHRVWVPYPIDVSEAIENAFANGDDGIQFTICEKLYAVSFAMDPDGYGPRPHQYRVGKEHIHREVSRSERRRVEMSKYKTSHEEALDGHISFEDLKWMDIAHNKTRLLEHEMAEGKLDDQYSLDSVERAMRMGARTPRWAQAKLLPTAETD